MSTNLIKIKKYLVLFASVFIIVIGFGILVNLFFVDEILEMLKPNPSYSSSGTTLTLIYWSVILAFVIALLYSIFVLKKFKISNTDIIIAILVNTNLYCINRFVVKSINTYVYNTFNSVSIAFLLLGLLLVFWGSIMIIQKRTSHS